jgi:hypothetical protein
MYADFTAGRFEPATTEKWRPLGPRDLAAEFAALLDTASGVR